ncbi:hypothetical protein WA026_022844 [Henosepilachna vigintioctopunctata]|uniref:Farnesol dehydrogenase n=1 Tax=Henosepilachna vigintioctopunctata TaxID=420089 RepID=A0AAW1V5S5_9CUCU
MVHSMAKWMGKVAVVTGASEGIGAAIAERLVENGMKVIGLARRVELIEENAKKLTGKSGDLHGIKVDVRNTQEILEAFELIEKTFGPVHVLVNSAGIFKNTSLSDGDIEAWKAVLDVNVLGLCVATKAALSSMKKNAIDGHIIHLNSMAGHYVPKLSDVHLNMYPASKYAVTALTESLRIELSSSGSKIKVTSISPGYVRTNLLKTAGWNDLGDSPFVLNAEDIAEAAVYVLSTPLHVQIHELIISPMEEVE